MELELEQERMIGYELAVEKTIRQEETLESIVPDACPDILRISDVCGCPVITDKEVREDSASVAGRVQASVLYEPEGENRLCKMEVSIPFTCRLPVSGLTDHGKIIAEIGMRHAEARILNPRKILLRIDIDIHIQAYRPFERRVCCAVCTDQDDTICQKQTETRESSICDIAERPFLMETQFRLKGGPESARALTLRAEPVCSEHKLIGNKLILKGSVELVVLSQDSNGLLSAARESVPFSQIMEVNGGEDCDIPDLKMMLQSMEWTPDPDDRGLITVSANLLAQASVRRSRPLVLLEDLYSTRFQMECKTESMSFLQLGEETAIAQPVRELVESDPAVHTLIDSSVCVGELSQSRQGQTVQLSASTILNLLYLDQESHLHRLVKELPVTCSVDCAPGLECDFSCSCPDDIYAAPSAGGVELRFSVEFHCRMMCQSQITAVVSAQLGEERDRSGYDRPSVILRLPSEGETLWDIAKLYGTTEEQITAANHLEETAFSPSSMLLIPGAH